MRISGRADPTIGRPVLQMVSYPIANLRHAENLYKREKAQASEPQCAPQYGIARLDDTLSNIGHLYDVRDTLCVVEPGVCARPSMLNGSAIFFCNEVDHRISTPCENLIPAAALLADKCSLGNHYTFGYIFNTTDEPQGYPYIVAVGDESVFKPKLLGNSRSATA
ncbi:hypothetical protein BJX96DRAFT_157094 [Aspergillus floccosus]